MGKLNDRLQSLQCEKRESHTGRSRDVTESEAIPSDTYHLFPKSFGWGQGELEALSLHEIAVSKAIDRFKCHLPSHLRYKRKQISLR